MMSVPTTNSLPQQIIPPHPFFTKHVIPLRKELLQRVYAIAIGVFYAFRCLINQPYYLLSNLTLTFIAVSTNLVMACLMKQGESADFLEYRNSLREAEHNVQNILRCLSISVIMLTVGIGIPSKGVSLVIWLDPTGNTLQGNDLIQLLLQLSLNNPSGKSTQLAPSPKSPAQFFTPAITRNVHHRNIINYLQHKQYMERNAEQLLAIKKLSNSLKAGNIQEKAKEPDPDFSGEEPDYRLLIKLLHEKYYPTPQSAKTLIKRLIGFAEKKENVE